MRMAVIVNPRSANGRTGLDWPAIEREVVAAHAPAAIELTQYPGHATELARGLLEQGYDQIVSVGGDGTHHEVLNGFFDGERRLNPEAVMAILPQGTGSDLARSLQIGNVQDGLVVLKSGAIINADVGRVNFRDHHGKEAIRYFLNCAHIGLGGHVAQMVNRTSKAMGGFLSFLAGVIRGLITYKSVTMSVDIDGHAIHARIHDIIIANAQWDGGGMFIAPDAALDSGVFEVYVISALNRIEALRNLPMIYKGKLKERPDVVQYFQARRIEADSPETVLINLEGEQPGRLPVVFEILPGALRLRTGRQQQGLQGQQGLRR